MPTILTEIISTDLAQGEPENPWQPAWLRYAAPRQNVLLEIFNVLLTPLDSRSCLKSQQQFLLVNQYTRRLHTSIKGSVSLPETMDNLHDAKSKQSTASEGQCYSGGGWAVHVSENNVLAFQTERIVHAKTTAGMCLATRNGKEAKTARGEWGPVTTERSLQGLG